MGRTKEAHAAEVPTDAMSTMQANMQALMAENQRIKQQNDELSARNNHMDYALQVETARNRNRGGDDDSTISTITDAMSQLMDTKLSAYAANLSNKKDQKL